MRRVRLHLKPTPVSKLSFEDLYEELSHDWESKANKLQARRWRALRHQTKYLSF